MNEKNFNVVFSKKNLIIPMCCLCFLEIVLIIMIFTWDYVVATTIYAIYLFLIILFALLARCLFCVKVNESVIKVRTRLGRKYEFNCSDIEKVVCSKRDSVKYGPIYYLNVKARGRELSMVGTMIGFDTMAGYILEKYETGDINHTAVSESCKKMLRKYKNGDLYKKKK